jgi:hypothetical protein
LQAGMALVFYLMHSCCVCHSWRVVLVTSIVI